LGAISIAGTVYTEPFLLSEDKLIHPWEGVDSNKMSEQAVSAILAWSPELVILGTGAVQRFPAASELQMLIEAQIGVECMDTAAACRTFNILLAEGRRVVAGLIP